MSGLATPRWEWGGGGVRGSYDPLLFCVAKRKKGDKGKKEKVVKILLF